jgi:hypothetical protein
VVYIGNASSRVRIQGCNFINLDGVNTIITTAAVNVVEILDCEFVVNPADVSTAYHDSSIIYYNSTSLNPYAGLKVDGCHFYGTTGGEAIGWNGSTIDLGWVGAGTAIETHGGHQQITNNWIVNFGCGANLTGISDPPTRSIIFTGNKIIGARFGVQVYSLPYRANLLPMIGVKIEGNYFDLDMDAWSEQNPGYLYRRGIYVHAALAVEQLTVANNTIKFRAYHVTPSAADAPDTGIYLVAIPYRSVNRGWKVLGNFIDSPGASGIRIQAYIIGLEVAGNWVRNAGQITALSTVYRTAIGEQGDGRLHSFHHNECFDDQDPPTTKFFFNLTALGAPLSAPANVVATQTTGGTLADGTYEYVVTAYTANGATVASTVASVTVTGGGGTAAVRITWDPVGYGTGNGAAGYSVFGRAVGSPGLLGLANAVLNPSFTDEGTETPGPAPGFPTAFHDVFPLEVRDNLLWQTADPTVNPVTNYSLDLDPSTSRAPKLTGDVDHYQAPTGNARGGSVLDDRRNGVRYEQTAYGVGTSWLRSLGPVVYPAAVPGGIFWGRPSAGTMFQSSVGTTAVAASNDPVGYWADQFAEGTLPAALQATGGSRPLYQASIQNGLPMLLFDGADDALLLDALSTYYTGTDQPFAAFFVAKAVDNTGTRRLFGMGRSTNVAPFHSVDSAAHFGQQRRDDANTSANIVTTDLPNTTCHVVVAWFDGTYGEVEVDGVVVANGAMNVGAATLDRVTLGGLVRNAGLENPYSGYIGEVILYKGLLFAGDRIGIRNYLVQQWLR